MPSNSLPRRFAASTSALVLVGLGLAGCQTGGGAFADAGLFTRSKTPTAASSPNDWRREVAVAGERYKTNPRDAAIALRYAEALRKTGQRAQAAAVLQQASIHHPNDMRVLGAYGRALADTGNLTEALDILARAHSPDQPDWRILSAQGAVLDQLGRNEEARRYYSSALKIAPDEPSVLSNLGLSYALSRNLVEAEKVLRSASQKGADEQRVRQNLSLVVGLQGRFQEAEEIVRADLPPEEAAANVSYLRQMIAEQKAKAPKSAAAPRRLRTAGWTE